MSDLMNAALQRWCILRTSGRSTLPLAQSLAGAGFDVWTPREVISRRRGPARTRIEYEAPLIATFVFARAIAIPALERILMLPSSPHPPFSIFRYYGKIPLLAAHAVDALREEEAERARIWQEVQDEERRAAEHTRLREEQAAQSRQMHVEHEQKVALRRALRATAPTYAAGTEVSVPQSAFAGLTGVVEGRKGRSAIVNFGGSMSMKIDAWLLTEEQVYDTASRKGSDA